MEWSERMNMAINYIEDNIKYELLISEVAKIANCSSFHFQRMFYAIIGITPAEYIRRRRLNLAASDLAAGNEKVIDIALKYGYESPNAFTRAFRNMHGINPREVRSSEVKLSAYNRVSFHIEIKGGNDMDYKIVEKPSFELVGKSKNFTHENFFKEGPKFWKEYVCTDEYQELWNLTNGRWGEVTDSPLISVYLPSEKNDESFIDILGVEKSDSFNNDKFELFQIPAATYRCFQIPFCLFISSTLYKQSPKNRRFDTCGSRSLIY
tara:strand:- start:244 stop:1038 length:795 start_codon:yes stop_codon:yes gene_type:complete